MSLTCQIAVITACSFGLLPGRPAAAEPPLITLLRTPDGGIQPQAASDSKGVMHLIYYKGDPAGGDIFYTTRQPRQETFSKSLQVNTQPSSAIALGTIRGAQLAIGKSNRVHVVWNGSAAAKQAVRAIT